MTVDAVTLFLALLTVAANAFVLAVLSLWAAGKVSPRARALGRRLGADVASVALGFAWVVALTATAGSLYFSEVAHFAPCSLCWYQRIAMYPQAVILGIAAFRRDVGVRRYVLPVVAIGAAISLYHYQLERFPSQGSLGCSFDVPCTFVWVWRFHYISIPFMALSAFALIATLLALAGAKPPEESAPTRQEVLEWAAKR